jgi:hypothetical protein
MATANRIVPEMSPSFECVEGSSVHLKSILIKLLRRNFAYQLAMISAPNPYWIAVRSDVVEDTHCQLLCGGTKNSMEKRGKNPSNIRRPSPVSKESVQRGRC